MIQERTSSLFPEYEERPSDSPYIARVWRTRSEAGRDFTSLAISHSQMVLTKHRGRVRITVRGPETRPTPAYCPPEAEFFGFYFKMGAHIPYLSVETLVDASLDLPDASGKSFWLNGSAWEFPNFENVETFAARLAREGLLVSDPQVAAAQRGQPVDLSPRSVQRRHLNATGLTIGAVRQIDRARLATRLLLDGASILDVVYDAGYADQPHLTRALRRFTGRTPAELQAQQFGENLSLLFKTAPFV